jgi:uncharacterized protein (TIGR03435 family)
MNIMKCAAIALGTLLAHGMTLAQVRPQFEIADVQVSPTNPNPAAIPMMQGGVARNGVYRSQTATMVDLIKTAYGVDAEKVLGGPSWLELDRFDIVARVPASTSADTARLMLQALLADRFTLVLHEDSRPMPGFALKAGKAPKLKRANGSGSSGCTSTALYTDAELGARRQAATQAGEKPVILQTYLHTCRNITMTAFAEGMRNMADAPDVRSPGPLPGGRFEVRNFSLKQLIVLAWGLSGSELTGAPAWLNSARVDITAKLPSTEATREIVGVVDINAFQPALKALLMERFKLAIHTEQQAGSGYALVAAKPRLQKADPATRTTCVEGAGANGRDPRASNPLLSRLVTCRNMTMGEFAKQLPRLSRGYIRSEVLDATGIKGSHDFALSFSDTVMTQAAMAPAAGGPGATDPVGGLTIFAALEKQLGLKLEKRNIPVPVVVLDHIEETPADN